MLMGLVSFVVMMIETGAGSSASEEWLTAIDFFHIFLFYYTLCFVAHALYLIHGSSSTAFSYRKSFYLPLKDVISNAEQYITESKNSWMNFLSPQARLARSNVIFHLLFFLFKKKYTLPRNFNFALYLTICLQRYAVKTIDRSTFTWLVHYLINNVSNFF
jgi:hypothetical protein